MTLVVIPEEWEEGEAPTGQTQGHLHFRAQSSDALPRSTGSNSVRSQAPGKRCTSGRKLRGEGRTPTAHQALPPPLQDAPTSCLITEALLPE